MSDLAKQGNNIIIFSIFKQCITIDEKLKFGSPVSCFEPTNGTMGQKHFKDLPLEKKTYKICLRAIKRKHTNYQYIPPDHRVGEINQLASQSISIWPLIPTGCWTDENYDAWWGGMRYRFQFDFRNFSVLPEHVDKQKFCDWMFSRFPRQFQYIPDQYKQQWMADYLYQHKCYWDLLQFIPITFQSPKHHAMIETQERIEMYRYDRMMAERQDRQLAEIIYLASHRNNSSNGLLGGLATLAITGNPIAAVGIGLLM